MKNKNIKAEEYPLLNQIDMFPVEDRGQQLYCLRNPDTPDIPPLVISELALYIIQFFDGSHSISEIIDIFDREYSVDLGFEDIGNLVKKLDDALLLQSANYLTYKKNVKREFHRSDTIEPAHSGLCYPSDAEELKEFIDRFYQNGGIAENNAGEHTVKAIISPHIDYIRGWRSYIRAYSELIDSKAKKFIILGTSHYADTRDPYILTKKSFSTPFGTVKTDTEFVERLENICGYNLCENEFAFRTEHSIEFQIVFLQHILGSRKDYTVVPILCNSFNTHVQSGKSPYEDVKVAGFINSLKDTAIEYGDEVIYIAGVDMAHYGLKFGDENKLDDSTLQWIEQRDKLTLSKITELDNEGFYRSVEEEKDKRKVCGLSSIYTLLSVTDAKNAEILDYDRALEENSEAVITYASATLFD